MEDFKVAFISSEIFPYAKTGGLADVSQALPHALFESSVDICSYTLMYDDAFSKKSKPIDALEVSLDGKNYNVDIYLHVDKSGYSTYLFSNQELFVRDKIYENRGDNHLRFALFCKTVVRFASKNKIDILHLNDWQSALCAYYVKKDNLALKTLLTLHNLGYQGVFPAKYLSQMDIDEEEFRIDGFEFYRHINLLKGGINYADYLTTVSLSYAKEIMSSEAGQGLEGVMKQNSYKLEGIPNKIDTDLWNPASDEYIFQTYTETSYTKKKQNKKLLLKELGLSGEKAPLFVMISRLVPQKGIEFLKHVVPYIKELEINLVLLGDGESREIDELSSIFNKCDNLEFINGYSEQMSHKLYASADFLLMPSLEEPCGLNQLIAYRYGVLPLVRETGGLKDSVIDYSLERKDKGVGVVFKNRDALSFYHALFRCVSLYAKGDKYTRLAKSNMKLDLSWGDSSVRYIDIYNKLRGKNEWK
ncbi:MAG: glycogen synthase [Campylobacterales bacterium]